MILSLFENFIYDATSSICKSFWIKRKQKKYFSLLKKKIETFCVDNESTYIDSGAFVCFLKYQKPIDRIMRNAIAVENAVSVDTLIIALTDEAQAIAEQSDRKLSYADKQMISDLCKLIDDSINNYYYNKLSSKQRYMVSCSTKQTEKLCKHIDQVSQGEYDHIEEIKNIVRESTSLSDYKAEPIAELICKKMWIGQFNEIEDLLPLVVEKSKDIELAIAVMKAQMFETKTTFEQQVNLISQINNITIKNCVIRNIIPLLYFRDISVECLIQYATGENLKNIISSISQKDFAFIFSKETVCIEGIKTYTFILNKQLMTEEEWIVKQLLAVYLYKVEAVNSVKVIEDMVDISSSWFSLLILYDKKVDVLQYENMNGCNKDKILTIENKLLENRNIYDRLADDIKIIYYSLLLKSSLCSQDGKYEEIEKEIPIKLKESKSIKDFVLACRIDNKQIEFNELYDYCKNFSEYWLLTNYMIKIGRSGEVIKIISEHIELLEMVPDIFFIYVEGLFFMKNVDGAKELLEKYKEKYNGYYDYWNVYLYIDQSDDIRQLFIAKCRDNNLIFLNKKSECFIVERLIELGEYDIASKYVKRLEVQQGETSQIKKYRALIMYGNNKNIDALELFKSIFVEYSNDQQVINAIITISLLMKRKIEDKYIEAANALKIPRMYLLAAAGYASNGNLIDARRSNIRALLSSDDFRNPAFMQYLNFNLNNDSSSERTISRVEQDTAVYLKNNENDSIVVYCIYADKLLPCCPYTWNGDTHFYIENAAQIGIYKRNINDKIIIQGVSYTIVNIQSIDTYFGRLCFENIVKNGTAKAITTQVIDGKMDVESFVDQIKAFTPDEKNKTDWIKQYNNFQDVALPLFLIMKYYNATYTQFIESVLSDNQICIREALIDSKIKSERFVLSFASLIILKRIGITSDFINKHNTYIPESMQLQVVEDVTKMLNRYSQENVLSMGIYDGKPYTMETNVEEKNRWLQESGELKNYVDNISMVLNTHDLSGNIFDQVDITELFGIPDYDAVAICINDNYAIVSTEAIISSLKNTADVSLDAISITGWLIWCSVPCIDLIKYVHRMLKIGCLNAVTDEFMIYVINKFEESDDETKQQIFETVDKLLDEYSLICEKFKSYAIQALTVAYANTSNKVENPALNPIMKLLINHLMKLYNIRLGIRQNENGDYEIVTYQVVSE